VMMLIGIVASVVGTSGLIDMTIVRELRLQPASYPTRICMPIGASGLGGYFSKVPSDIYTLKREIFKKCKSCRVDLWMVVAKSCRVDSSMGVVKSFLSHILQADLL
jgi:hypothetical protein